MSSDNTRVMVGVTTIVVKDDAILMGRRKGCDGDGEWGLPGGHFEYGESLEEAAKRELFEETGMTADSIEFIGVINDPRHDCHWIHFSFIVKDVNGEPENLEPHKCHGWEWLPITSLPENIFIGHKRIIPAYLESKVFKDSHH